MKKILLSAFILSIFIGCSKMTEDEVFKKGIEAQKGEQFDEALEYYQMLMAEYPKSVKIPEALYATGTVYQDRKKDFHKAIEVYKRLAREYPAHATTSNALFLVGFIYHNELKNLDSARLAYEEFLQKYPDNPMTESAKFELANLGKDPAEIIKLGLTKGPKPGKKEVVAKRRAR